MTQVLATVSIAGTPGERVVSAQGHETFISNLPVRAWFHHAHKGIDHDRLVGLRHSFFFFQGHLVFDFLSEEPREHLFLSTTMLHFRSGNTKRVLCRYMEIYF